jgi:glucose-6-phosphate 1-dehydrogenase
MPHLAFEANEPPPNVLRLLLEPDRVIFGLNLNCPGTPFALERVDLAADRTSGVLPAYARLLLHILEGDSTLSIRDDEAEESWRVVEPILDAWARGRSPLREYPAGSAGPGQDARRAGERREE